MLQIGCQIALGLLLNDGANHQQTKQRAPKGEDEKWNQERRPHPQPVHHPPPPVPNGDISFRGRIYTLFHE